MSKARRDAGQLLPFRLAAQRRRYHARRRWAQPLPWPQASVSAWAASVSEDAYLEVLTGSTSGPLASSLSPQRHWHIKTGF